MQKHLKYLSAAVMTALSLPMTAENVHISTPGSSLVLDATEGKPLKILYYGKTLAPVDIENLSSAGAANLDAYPVYGNSAGRETALSAIHADGGMITELNVTGVSETTNTDGSKITTVSMADTLYPFNVDVKYRTWTGEDVIETWTEITSHEKGTVELSRFLVPGWSKPALVKSSLRM